MDLLTLLFRLPYMPLKGFLKLGQLIADEAEREYHDPARVRRELEEAQQQEARGEISAEDMAQVEAQATAALIAGTPPARKSPEDDGS